MATTTTPTPDSTKSIVATFVATTPEETEKYLTYLERHFVKVKDGKPDPEFKDFYYKVESIYPSYFGWGNEKDVKMRFLVTKFNKKEMRTVTMTNGGQIKVASQVPMHVQQNGKWVVYDEDAELHINCEDFDKKFKSE